MYNIDKNKEEFDIEKDPLRMGPFFCLEEQGRLYHYNLSSIASIINLSKTSFRIVKSRVISLLYITPIIGCFFIMLLLQFVCICTRFIITYSAQKPCKISKIYKSK
jgi:uncharacterized membrane protein